MEFKENAVSIKNLTKKFGDATILNNLSFDIKNSITTILGFSGAGKVHF